MIDDDNLCKSVDKRELIKDENRKEKEEYDYDEEKTYIALGNGRGDDAVAWLLRIRRVVRNRRWRGWYVL